MDSQYCISIKPLNKFKKHTNIIICGLSVRAKNLIKNNKIPVNYILDNNKKLINNYFLNKKIISEEEIKKIKNPTIIILANTYIEEFLLQIIKLDIKCKIIIESNLQMIANLIPNFNFLIEMPLYINDTENQRLYTKVPPLIFKNIVSFNIPIQTITKVHSYVGHFTKRTPKKNQMLFSFHSMGKEKFNIFRYKEGYLNDIITYDTEGYGGFSSKIDKNEVKKIPVLRAEKDFNFFANKYIKQNLSKYTQPKISNIDLPKNYVFFATQTANDTVMKLSYYNPIDLLKSLIYKFSKQKNLSLVIKRHPECNNEEVSEILNHTSKYNNIYVIDASIHTLISNAKAVYAINSGVGFEALLHLKPVVLFGKSDYESACFTCKDLDKLQIVPKITAKKKEYIKKFISYYMEERNFLIDDENKIKKVIDKALAKFFIYHLQKKYKCKVKIYI